MLLVTAEAQSLGRTVHFELHFKLLGLLIEHKNISRGGASNSEVVFRSSHHPPKVFFVSMPYDALDLLHLLLSDVVEVKVLSVSSEEDLLSLADEGSFVDRQVGEVN
jgi:hypothetical protein